MLAPLRLCSYPSVPGHFSNLHPRLVRFVMREKNLAALSNISLTATDNFVKPAPEGSCVAAIRLEPARAEDAEFLYQTFASTRAEEMAITGWNKEQIEHFLRVQFEAQRQSYLLQTPDAEYSVIRCGETAVGRLIVERTPTELHIVDIALLPQFRRQGIGSYLMKEILSEAEETKKSVRLFVERFNPALFWYQGLGFEPVSSGPIYLEMVGRPACENLEGSDSGTEAELAAGACDVSD
jgi:ribosomal protein S18 acetylase RimI-like enzyme